MVQKGLGWLLRETAKFDARKTVPYLMKIRERAPRLVLRTACETLPAVQRRECWALRYPIDSEVIVWIPLVRPSWPGVELRSQASRWRLSPHRLARFAQTRSSCLQ